MLPIFINPLNYRPQFKDTTKELSPFQVHACLIDVRANPCNSCNHLDCENCPSASAEHIEDYRQLLESVRAESEQLPSSLIEINQDCCWGEECEAYFWGVASVCRGEPCKQTGCEYQHNGFCCAPEED